jgi:hypothetical protein
MKYLSALVLFVAGGGVGWLFGSHLGRLSTPVYAQSNMIESGCTSNIPQRWGPFKGATEHGFVFEDDRGTIRVVKHPPCGMTGGDPRIDMLITRH